MYGTQGVSRRLRVAMAANGISSADVLAGKAGVSLETVEALLQDEPSRVDAVSLLKLKDALRFPMRWLLMEHGSPTQARQLTPDESWVLDVYRSLPPEHREIIHHALKNLVA